MRLLGETVFPDSQLAAPVVDFKSVVLLIVYLLLIVVAAYFLTKLIAKRSLQKGMRKKPGAAQAGRKTARKGRSRFDTGELLSIEDRIVLDREKTLIVVEFDQSRYLIGVSGQEIKLIDKVPAPPPQEKENSDNDEAGASMDEDGTASLNIEDETQKIYAQDAAMSFPAFLKRFGQNFKKTAYLYFHKDGKKAKNKKSAPPMDFSEQLKDEIEKEDSKDQEAGEKEKDG